MPNKTFSCLCECLDCKQCEQCCNKPKILSDRTRGLGPYEAFKEGKRGPRGYQGIPGAPGMTGAVGMDGFDGNTGPQGFQGFQGEQPSLEDICARFELEYPDCTRCFIFDDECPPSIFASFSGICVNGNEVVFDMALTFSELNEYLLTEYELSYVDPNKYCVIFPSNVTSFSIKPVGYLNPSSDPINSLESIVEEQMYNILVCGESGPGFVSCDNFINNILHNGSIGVTGATGSAGVAGPAGPAGPSGIDGTMIKCGTMYSGVTAPTSGVKSGPADTGDYCLALDTGDIFVYNGSTFELVNPQPHPFYYLDTNNGIIYHVLSTPSTPIQLECNMGDFFLSDDGILYKLTGASGWQFYCNLNGGTESYVGSSATGPSDVSGDLPLNANPSNGSQYVNIVSGQQFVYSGANWIEYGNRFDPSLLPQGSGVEPGGLSIGDIWIDTSVTVGGSSRLMIKLT